MESDLLIKVLDRSKNVEYYGGDQGWFDTKTAKEYGCGVIALANVIITHERLTDRKNPGILKVEKSRYMQVAEVLKKKYLPIIPKLGISGIELAIGANAYFLKNGLNVIARWGVKPNNLWDSVDRMLKKNWPVILAIGPNNTLIGKKCLDLQGDVSNSTARAHYVTITAADEATITVSSWGSKYVILKEDYEAYMKKISNPLFSNILYIK